MAIDVVVTEKHGVPQRLRFDRCEINFGRAENNDVVLPGATIDARHARVVLKEGKLIVVDLKTVNGTFVNGRRLTSPQFFQSTDTIHIGDFAITVQAVTQDAAVSAPVPPAPPGPRHGYPGPPTSIGIDITFRSTLVERRQFSGFSAISIGRGSDNTIVLDDAAIPPHCAVLQTTADGLVIVNQGGGARVEVDGTAVVDSLELYPGAAIALGPFILGLR